MIAATRPLVTRYLVSGVAVVSTAAALLVGAPQPAFAETPVISVVDTSQVGHAKGTVATTSPYLRIDLHRGSSERVVLGTPQQVVGGVATFDFQTWGLANAMIKATTCTDASTCNGAPVSAGFTPVGVAPSVTWPAITQVGSDGYPIEVSDPNGGGSLRARWGSQLEPVARSGQTVLHPSLDGANNVLIQRCHPVEPRFCSNEVASPTIVVNTQLYVPDVSPSTAVLGPGDLQHEVEFSAFESDDFTLDWGAENASGPIAGLGGRFTHLDRDVFNKVRATLDLTDAPSGQLTLRYTLTADAPGWGTLTGTFWSTVRIDREGPAFKSAELNANTIYPVVDGHLDEADLQVYLKSDDTAEASAEVVDSLGNPVRDLGTKTVNWQKHARFFWAGNDGTDQMVPEGDYVIRLSVVDHVGNVTAQQFPVTVSHKIEVARSMTITRKAAASLVAKNVGSCSRLAKPARSSWPGSLGIWSNDKCINHRGRGGLITTDHAIQLPVSAHRFGRLDVSAYGARPNTLHSHLGVRTYYVDDDGRWQDSGGVGGASRWHKLFGRDVGDRAVHNSAVTVRFAADSSYGWDVWKLRVTVQYFVVEYPTT